MVVGVAGRDEENVAFGRTKKTDGYEAVRVAFSGGRSCHGVPRATIVLAKTSIFPGAGHQRAALCSFSGRDESPVKSVMSCLFQRNDAASAAAYKA